jgi:hypothetical protein
MWHSQAEAFPAPSSRVSLIASAVAKPLTAVKESATTRSVVAVGDTADGDLRRGKRMRS